jgi:hypothetical protein
MNGAMPQMMAAAALDNVDGMKAYVADMQQIGMVLQAPSPAFSWWTAVFLVAIFLVWCAALITAWFLLNRRFRGNSSGPAANAACAQLPALP